MTSDGARQLAFDIVTRHSDCLQDDYSLQDFIDDIADSIIRAINVAKMKWDEGEHEGCGKDSERAYSEFTSQERSPTGE